MKTLKTVGLVAIVAAAVMVYAEVRDAGVTHTQWARMLLRAIELEDDLPKDATNRLLFSTLSWKQSLAYPAERYLRARGVDVVGPAGARRVVAANGVAEVAYPVAVVRGGDYRLRVEISGNPAQPATADITPVGDTRPLRQFTVAPPAASAWVEAGAAHLDPGAYTAAVTLPSGSSLRRVEVAPRCLTAIEPAGGWRDPAIASADDVAVTAVQALDLVSELPPADAPIEIPASEFRLTGASDPLASADAPDGLSVRGGPRGVRALLVVNLPAAGLYTLSAFGLATLPQGWLVDECHKAIVCPQPERAAAGPGWRPVLTAPFTAGRHSFVLTLPPGAEVGRVRLERKKDAPGDYRATLARAGFDVGAPGPIARERAEAAMEFIRGERRKLPQTGCGDVLPPETLEAGLAEAAPVVGPGTAVAAGQPAGQVGVPLPGPPVTPPGTPPVTAPPATVPPPTTPPPVTVPPGPPSTVPPGPPPTVPPQPPGSPVTVSPTPPPGA